MICPGCAAEFAPKKAKQRFCSKACSGRHNALKTHCKRGHELSGDNLLMLGANRRQCRACADERRKAAPSTAALKDPVSVACPICKILRRVSGSTARHMKSMPRACRNCARKTNKQRPPQHPLQCAKCGEVFAGRSGSARFCDACAGRTPKSAKECPVCQRLYVGQANKTACSASCLRRIRKNETYFGGRMFDAIGWADKHCRICERMVAKKFHVHHVFGHPKHFLLVVLCPGCHDMVSKLAQRANWGDEQFRRLAWYAKSQRLAQAPEGEPVPEMFINQVLPA